MNIGLQDLTPRRVRWETKGPEAYCAPGPLLFPPGLPPHLTLSLEGRGLGRGWHLLYYLKITSLRTSLRTTLPS
jgi:hypothetical protein